jgi:tetratricopeptide (TPR) repeat protein
MALAFGGALSAAETVEERLATAQELIDEQRYDDALKLLGKLARTKPPPARAFLLRSDIHFINGDIEAGGQDLDRALEIDPDMRQAWLNRAALDLSKGRLDEALKALGKARQLDPSAPDSALNIGAVLVLKGDLGAATREFQEYLSKNPGSAEAYYLVATNYAVAGYAALAIQHLRQAIGLDERSRLRARTDPNFEDVESNPLFQQVLNTDEYRPAAGSHVAGRLYQVPWEAGGGKLLEAVINTLQLSGKTFDRRVEVTPGWALIWSDMRIKLSPDPGGGGRVLLTAPADRFQPADWTRESDEFFRQVMVQLGRLGALSAAAPPAPPQR